MNPLRERASNVEHIWTSADTKSAMLSSEGDTSSEMFIIQEGTVAVMKDVAGREVFLAPLGRGDYFGEMRRPSPDRLGNT